MPPRERTNAPRFNPSLWRLRRSRQHKGSLPGTEPRGQFIGRHTVTRRVLGKSKRCSTRAQNKKKKLNKRNTGGRAGFISWSEKWRRSRCTGRRRSRSSCWRFAAGGGRSVERTPGPLQRGRPPAMFHSSGLFAGGLCCSIHARPSFLAWRKTSTCFRILYILYIL